MNIAESIPYLQTHLLWLVTCHITHFGPGPLSKLQRCPHTRSVWTRQRQCSSNGLAPFPFPEKQKVWWSEMGLPTAEKTKVNIMGLSLQMGFEPTIWLHHGMVLYIYTYIYVNVTYLHTYIKHTHIYIYTYTYIYYTYTQYSNGRKLSQYRPGPCRSRTPKTSPAGFRAWRLERRWTVQ